MLVNLNVCNVITKHIKVGKQLLVNLKVGNVIADNNKKVDSNIKCAIIGNRKEIESRLHLVVY